MVVQYARWADLDPATHPFDPELVREPVEALVLAALQAADQAAGQAAGRSAEQTAEQAARQAAKQAARRAASQTPNRIPKRIARRIDRSAVVLDLDRLFYARLGAWAGGWRWAATEPGGGGPVRGWCCERDSVFRDDDPDALATAHRALAALADWRAYLVELAGHFAALRAEAADLPSRPPSSGPPRASCPPSSSAPAPRTPGTRRSPARSAGSSTTSSATPRI